MRQLLCFSALMLFWSAAAQCDCEVFSKTMQKYRVENFQLQEQLSQYEKLDSNYKMLIQKQRQEISFLKKNQDSLASVPKPLLNKEDEHFYLEKLKMYYLHSGDSTKAAQIKNLLLPVTGSGNEPSVNLLNK